MTDETFKLSQEEHRTTMERIADAATRLHDIDVNQRYGADLPYSFHLRSVAEWAMRYAHEVLATVDDLLPVYFGAWFHDSIEDARLTYNDVHERAGQFMNPTQALMAVEIVYALTNDKGRTRSERAGEQYYAGIRNTPYAPLIKLADRVANMSFSLRTEDTDNANYKTRMVDIYRSEMSHFIQAITGDGTDSRCCLPPDMVQYILSL